jgi:serine/threonine-protein kinase HipA
MNDATVILWGKVIGGVSWLENREIGVFQFSPEFVRSGIQLSPLKMPLQNALYSFPDLPKKTFWGLPGMLADSLPDKFGNSVINAWLARQGRLESSLNPVERLCYTGKRGMGALEFKPALLVPNSKSKRVEVSRLVELSNMVLDQRMSLHGEFNGHDDSDALKDILRVGTSAGGARAKAILAWNPDTNEFRSGQVASLPGFQYWIMKFDGISNNKDKEIADPQGFGKIEYAYYLMAEEAGIDMMPCRLHEENGRSHFMTKRFDRTDDGEKIHMQSLGAIAHIDFNQPALYSYEEAVLVMKKLGLPQPEVEQLVLRAYFNVVARNQDDHVKNIAFLMNQGGEWRLSPAFDMIYAYNPEGNWTNGHQMTINGKRNAFTREDLLVLANVAGIKNTQAGQILDRVIMAVKNWERFAEKAGVSENDIRNIQKTHRTEMTT